LKKKDRKATKVRHINNDTRIDREKSWCTFIDKNRNPALHKLEEIEKDVS
jgi:hypothetical protein